MRLNAIEGKCCSLARILVCFRYDHRFCTDCLSKVPHSKLVCKAMSCFPRATWRT